MVLVTKPVGGAAGRNPVASGLPLAGKITLFLLVVVSLTALGIAWLGQDVVLRKFGETESELVLRNRDVLLQAIQAGVDNVDTIALDWSQWTDLYDYARGRNPDFDTGQINPTALDRLKLDVIQLLSAEGQLISEEVRTGVSGQDGQLSPRISTEIRLAAGKMTRPFSGWLNTSIGPLIVASHPILRSDATGPAAGFLIMARRLDLAALSAGVSVLPSEVVVHGSAYTPIAPALLALMAQLENAPDSATLILRDTDMSDFRYFRDINGQPAFLLEIRMPRTVLATARETTYQLSIVLLGFGGIIFLLLIAVIRLAVSLPLGKLASHMSLLRETGEFRLAPGADIGDEIGTLARSFNDLTITRQNVEAELRALSAVAEHADESIAIFAPDNTFVWVNPVFEHSRGMTRADLIGRRPQEVIKGLDDPAMYLGIREAMQSCKTWKGRIRSEVGDGRIITEDVVISAVLDKGQSEPSAYVMLLHDVSECVALEAQLAQTQRLEAVEQLAAGVAHEINTPAQYVDGNVRFLDEAFNALFGVLEKIAGHARASGNGELFAAELTSLLTEAEVEYLQAEVPVAIRHTLEGVGRISSIVQSLKELTDPAPDFVPANLNSIIEGAVCAVRNEWTDVADFRVQLDPQLRWVSCEPESINQVVTSMLVNASQAIAESAKGHAVRGQIVVGTRCAGAGVEITISDDGVGMTPSVRERIFDPFFTTRPVGQGTGQGLSTAHNVIRKHRGTIVVDSTPGGGSCFRIYLPLANDQAVSGGHQDPQLLRNAERLAG
jgi:PAS domain S-box-containing protein